jgi:tRNA threonylcarbamoyl adenosine modification protein (Sua5/YciO/YrdC/YwlC family)
MSTEVVRVENRADVAAELRRAGEILRAGGLVAFPTETVYGIAVAATVPAAVERLYAIKGRPRDKPMTVMVADVADVLARCPNVSPAARRLMERFWPGPLTLVLEDAQGRMTGFRLPNHPLARGLVRAAGVPLLVPSANRSSNPPATTREGVLREFPSELDLVIDGGSAEGGVPSTVVQVTANGVDVLRAGAIPESRIVDGTRTSVLFVCAGNTDRSPLAAASLRKRLAERLGVREGDLEDAGWDVSSAGLVASDGRPASPSALRAAREAGLDLEGHRSRRLTEEILERATHVYCMERAQVEPILAFFPGREKDVRLVDPEGHDVEDPVGKSLLAYKRLTGRLDAAASLIAGGLVASASSS